MPFFQLEFLTLLFYYVQKFVRFILNKTWAFLAVLLKLGNTFLTKLRHFINYAMSNTKNCLGIGSTFVNMSEPDLNKVPIKLVLGNVLQLADQKMLAKKDKTLGMLFNTAFGKAKQRCEDKELKFDRDVVEEAKIYTRPLSSTKDVPFMECTKTNAPINANSEYLLLRAYGYVWAEIEEKEQNACFSTSMLEEKRKRREKFAELKRQIDKELEENSAHRIFAPVAKSEILLECATNASDALNLIFAKIALLLASIRSIGIKFIILKPIDTSVYKHMIKTMAEKHKN